MSSPAARCWRRRACWANLSAGLDVSIRTAGLLITFGAVVLCVGSPVTAWLTSRIERRTLLTATLAVLALGQFRLCVRA